MSSDWLVGDAWLVVWGRPVVGETEGSKRVSSAALVVLARGYLSNQSRSKHGETTSLHDILYASTPTLNPSFPSSSLRRAHPLLPDIPLAKDRIVLVHLLAASGHARLLNLRVGCLPTSSQSKTSIGSLLPGP